MVTTKQDADLRPLELPHTTPCSQAMAAPEDPRLERAVRRLRAHGCRITRKRRRLLRALIGFDHPASAEEIRRRAEWPASDLVTVYRNLDAFGRAGLVQRLPLEDGTHLFELTAPDEHFHHVICRSCHRAERLDACVGERLFEEARARGYSRIGHVMEIYGLCPGCASREPG